MPHTKVVFSFLKAFHEDVVKASAAGMSGHLAKPIDPEVLYQMLVGAIDDQS